MSVIHPPLPRPHILSLFIITKILSGKTLLYANWVGYFDNIANGVILAKFETQVGQNPDWQSQLSHPKTKPATLQLVTYMEDNSALLVSGPAGETGVQGAIFETPIK